MCSLGAQPHLLNHGTNPQLLLGLRWSGWKSALNYIVVIDSVAVPLKPLLRGEGVRLGRAFMDVRLCRDD